MQLSTAPRPIRTVLIANRGEIACRIMRTCRRLGHRCVAVYSDADRDALHVRFADASHRLGPPAARASYLDIDAIIRAVRASGADAVHPGYGFLSENPAFVARCEAEGINFIGPSAAAVTSMGSKIEAKKIAAAAGVPTVPGYHGEDQSEAALAREAARIGFPVLIKASAGGGGRGMRLVNEPRQFSAALLSARKEAVAAFGDESVLLEKFVTNPRHLEVQLIGDQHGNLVHVFERDCSVQRNNQKLIEEAPAPNLDDQIRRKLFDRALTLGRAIGYTSAGTVEFVMEAGGSEPYFLEMNTRLQVEHPVTEAIAGIDLVEWQLRVAAGLPLPLKQEQIETRGHAIEVRLAAERPDANFQPSVGVFVEVESPPDLRFDTGIEAGSEVSLHYDSMIAKLIAHGPDRSAALGALKRGLGLLTLLGPATNQRFLLDCVSQPAFEAGRATTAFLAAAFPNGWLPATQTVAAARAAAAASPFLGNPDPTASVWQRRTGFRVSGSRRAASLSLEVADEYGSSSVLLKAQAGAVSALVDEMQFDLGSLERPLTSVAGAPARFSLDGERVYASVSGLAISAKVSTAVDAPRETEEVAASHLGNALTAPLPGVVSHLPIKVGDPVEEGDTAFQIEAMKLIHTVAVPRPGVISAVHCAVGDTVAVGAVLVELTSEEG